MQSMLTDFDVRHPFTFADALSIYRQAVCTGWPPLYEYALVAQNHDLGVQLIGCEHARAKQYLYLPMMSEDERMLASKDPLARFGEMRTRNSYRVERWSERVAEHRIHGREHELPLHMLWAYRKHRASSEHFELRIEGRGRDYGVHLWMSKKDAGLLTRTLLDICKDDLLDD
jgi:hypothetical protein